MAKKRKVRYDRLIVVGLVAILLLIALIFGIKTLVGLFSKNDENSSDVSPISPSVDSNGTTIEILKYSVYEDKNSELGFNFVVAETKFMNDDGVSYDLGNLVTSENISLDSYYDYEKKFNVLSYDFASLGTVSTISSSEKEYTCKLFIPYTDTKDLLTVTDKISNSSLKIDLTKDKGDIDTLKKKDNSSEINSNDYNISVSNCYISDMMNHNGESYDASMLAFYTFELKVNSISDDVKITDAVFKQTSTGESYDALDDSYSSVKIDNIINKSLNVGDVYALFFEVYSDPDEKPTYEGTITLYFSDNTSVEISAILN